VNGEQWEERLRVTGFFYCHCEEQRDEATEGKARHLPFQGADNTGPTSPGVEDVAALGSHGWQAAT
jgi:hypothetical protein